MKKRALQLALVFVLAFSAGVLSACQANGNSSDSATQAVRVVSGEEAQALMESESDYVVVDVRTESEYAEGHVPGAINIPLDTMSGSEVAQLPNKDQLIMLYCRSGSRSAQAASVMADMGYTNIVNFGGIMSWPGEIETSTPATA